MEKTLVIIKPGAIQRGLIGEVIHRFERKGLQLCGMKMMQLTDEILAEHYSHLAQRSFFKRIKDAMMITPVIVCCLKGVDAVHIVHAMAGLTKNPGARSAKTSEKTRMAERLNMVAMQGLLVTWKMAKWKKRFVTRKRVLG